MREDLVTSDVRTHSKPFASGGYSRSSGICIGQKKLGAWKCPECGTYLVIVLMAGYWLAVPESPAGISQAWLSMEQASGAGISQAWLSMEQASGAGISQAWLSMEQASGAGISQAWFSMEQASGAGISQAWLSMEQASGAGISQASVTLSSSVSVEAVVDSEAADAVS